MSNLFSILVSTLRAKILPIWVKLRLWLSPTFLRTRALGKIRDFIGKLFDVKPRHRKDYYGIFGWLVSKRLAFALVVVIGLGAVYYILMSLPENFFGGGSDSIPTYKYRSIPLKFHSGPVRILANEGYVAYDGEVDAGAAAGEGTLYDADGATVYTGQFADNKYNGTGRLYYPNGTTCYAGAFTDNEFNGVGTFSRPNGSVEYQGDYVMGVRTGSGTLYNSVGDPVFQGSFLNNEIVYADFLARPTTEVSGLYSGETQIYQSMDEYCVTMPEINAIYAVKDGSNTLENEWTVEQIFVLEDAITLDNNRCSSIRQLQEKLGDPLYFGTAWVKLPEAVAWNMLAKEQPDEIAPVDVTAASGLENVYTVSGYDRNYQLYLYTFEKEGMLYTFYFTGAGESQFVMYAMEKA